MNKKLKFFGLFIYGLGTTLLVAYGSWQLALAVFLCNWGSNIENKNQNV